VHVCVHRLRTVQEGRSMRPCPPSLAHVVAVTPLGLSRFACGEPRADARAVQCSARCKRRMGVGR
jgi:hypothetical protein